MPINAVYSIAVYDTGFPTLGLCDIEYPCNLSLILFKASTWGIEANSVCQALLIIMANTFLAFRLILS
jgi:hypothetical protein